MAKGGVRAFGNAAGNVVERFAAPLMKSADDVAEAGAKELDDAVEVVISRSRHPEAAQHIDDTARARGGPIEGNIDRPGAKQRRRDSTGQVEPKPNLDRDEVPPAVLDSGGKGASVRHISPTDNRGAGSVMGHQLRGLPNGTRVRIVIGD